MVNGQLMNQCRLVNRLQVAGEDCPRLTAGVGILTNP